MDHDKVLLQAIVDEDVDLMYRYFRICTIADLERIEKRFQKSVDALQKLIAHRKRLMTED